MSTSPKQPDGQRVHAPAPQTPPPPQPAAPASQDTAAPTAPTPYAAAVDLASADASVLFNNRELSWLDFNQRVLELAEDDRFPLLERVKFLAICASNLDEFFMKRVGGLQRQKASRLAEKSLDGLTPAVQLDLVKARVKPMIERQMACWFERLHPALKKQGIEVRSYKKLNEADKAAADEFFRRQVFPILTPLAVDPGHPFPFISNLSKSIGVFLGGETGEPDFVRIKVPENLPRWVRLPEQDRYAFVPLEQIIGGNLEHLFPGTQVKENALFRVTRNADVELDEEDADDLLAMVEESLRRRRMAQVVRLELPETMTAEMEQLIVDGLDVPAEDVYRIRGPIDMDDLFSLSGVERADLKFEPWKPLVPPRLRDDEASIFTVIRAGDVLVHHPFEDFQASVEHFITSAVNDPKVLAIKMTLYRTSSDSPFVPALIRAAEQGKQVAVLVELKARFDEQRNVELAQKLEKSGVHVVYGIVGLKTHTKLTMVVREEQNELRTYCHIGTGNYNRRTSQLYTDCGMFTCRPEVTQDVIEIFHYLTGHANRKTYRKLLVAPVNMRERFLEMIAREAEHARAGRPGLIRAKMNALQDAKVIKALYKASQAGVKIDLVVRGFCSLRAGVPGLSETIHVRSILGRFLEHSRLFHFHNAGQDDYFLGSADWMNRNLEYRVEAITPVEQPELQTRLDDVLTACLSEKTACWHLNPDGTWTRRHGKGFRDVQELLMKRTLKAESARRA
ncbi:MAG: polyphosphate kinase 1 [Phycisphaerae bacterium]